MRFAILVWTLALGASISAVGPHPHGSSLRDSASLRAALGLRALINAVGPHPHGFSLRDSASLRAPLGLRAQSENPAQPGFDAAGSDERAITIADDVMRALGGRKAWDATRFLTWSFFGRRTHVWDKYTGDLRFENEDTLVLMNLNTKKGRAWKSGEEVTDAAALAEILDRAEGAWINDSYWVFMPYKLKDSGVTLKYVGKGKTDAGEAADVIELTFEGVGRTPQNKYHVFVDEGTRLVTQWNYYENASDPEPRFAIPWRGWTEMGGIRLSADRGERRHENLAVLRDVPTSAFTSPSPVDPMQYAVGR